MGCRKKIIDFTFSSNTVSTSKMDTMLTSGGPWEFIDPINLEELKIPRCADHFIRLLDAIKERYCNLPQPRHQYAMPFRWKSEPKKYKFFFFSQAAVSESSIGTHREFSKAIGSTAQQFGQQC